MEEAEADRLLELGVALDLDVGPRPEAVEHLALGRAQPVEAGVPRLREAAADLGADRVDRAVARPAVGEELEDPQLLAGRDVGGDRHAPGVRGRLDVDGGAVGPVDLVIHRGRHQQAAVGRAVGEEHEPVVLVVLLGAQRRRQRGGGARVRVLGRLRPAVLVGDQLGLHDDPDRIVDGLDLVEDRGGAALGERDDARRGHPDLPADRRAPVHAALQEPGAEVEDALVLDQLAVADVEQLVVDEEPQELAVGDAEDGLARLGVAVGRLGVRQRPDLVEAVEVRAGQPVGLALVEVAAQADVAVGEREQRLALGEQLEPQARLAQGPRLDAEGGVLDHAPASSSSSARSRTTTSAPCGAQGVGVADPVDADDAPEPARAAGLDAGDRVLEHGRVRRRPRRARRAPARNVSGAGLPFRPSRVATMPSTISSNRSRIPAASRTSRQLELEETTARRSPASRAARDVADRALVDLDAVARDELEHEVVLAVAQAVDRLGARLVVGRAVREVDAARPEERADPVVARPAVDVLVVVRARVEGHERLAGALRALAQVVVEHLLPRGGMDLRGLREHAVEVEQARLDAVGQSQHAAETTRGAPDPGDERRVA